MGAVRGTTGQPWRKIRLTAHQTRRLWSAEVPWPRAWQDWRSSACASGGRLRRRSLTHQLWADGLRRELCRVRGRARRDASAALSVASCPCADTVHAVSGGSAVDMRGSSEGLQGELESREVEHVVHVRVFQARCEQKLQEHRREFDALPQTAKSFPALRNKAVRLQALDLHALRGLRRAKMAQLEVSSNLFSRDCEDSFATAKQVEEHFSDTACWRTPDATRCQTPVATAATRTAEEVIHHCSW